MAFPGPPAEAAAQSLAGTQSMQGYAGLGEIGQIGAGAATLGVGSLQLSEALALLALQNLGLTGPAPGVAPINAAYNVQFANYVNGLIFALAGAGAAQSILALGTGAQLANTGRNFLVSTYFGL